MASADQELREIFLEEATDLVSSISHTLQAWENDLQNLQKISDLKRDLHTLKGSARMVGLPMVSTLTHELESLCEALSKHQVPVDKSVFELIGLGQDQILSMLETLKQNKTPVEALDLIEKFHAYLPKSEIVEQLVEQKKEGSLDIVQVVGRKANEMIRVRTDVLEKLNSLSTENSMARIGIEQQLSLLNAELFTMKQNIKRLENQLNSLDLEIERTHSLLGSSDKNTVRSSMGQLNNSLKETHLDLEESTKVLLDACSKMETQILQQSRILTELQQRLTNTRLTPFESIVPRLSRIVRQISSELEKKVDFKITKSQGEMDRTVLEQLLPSLEHILRNAIDHGIESVEERLKYKKTEVGNIKLCFVRTGSNVSIEISDDGAGIQPDVIRRKAIQLGFLKSEEVVNDEEVIRYIMEPGFSTREVVTEISGRGVGMDVVNTAVKELGGNITIRSVVGMGTKMTIRFPFTISLNRILLFSVQNQVLGILLANIANVFTISSEALKKSVITLGEKNYPIVYLGALLHAEQKKMRIPKKTTFPVLLCDNSEYPVAIIIDNILYSRDLVVQALGPQFKLSNEFVGATTLGDGRIVFILDTYRLSMNIKALREDEHISENSFGDTEYPITLEQHAVTLVESELILVVDDSVSARTATKQLLAQQHFRVRLATDGLDALEKIEYELPALVISDIDMPRMNGLEFVKLLKEDVRYQEIPVIIVTSRTEEHLENLKLLGITHVLTKPYQSNELLELVERLLEENI